MGVQNGLWCVCGEEDTCMSYEEEDTWESKMVFGACVYACVRM